MITNKDLEIENISYTNKDFGQIYPELLELTKKLTVKAAKFTAAAKEKITAAGGQAEEV